MTSWRDDVRAALPGWVAGRVLVAAGWVVAKVLVEVRLDGVAPIPMGQGLYAWDGAYYRDIAAGGYGAVDPGGVRFHPLFPLIGQGGIGLLVVANVAALLAAVLVHRLVVAELDDADLARRAATLVGIAPPAFVLVWAYAEGPFLALTAALLLALRRERWVLVGVLGIAAGLTRPTAALLCVAVLVEAWRRRSPAGFAAATGPLVGIGAYLLWVGHRYGDALEPLRVQNALRHGNAFPPLRLLEGLGEIVVDPLGDGLHVPFAFGVLALGWVAWRRLPPAWGALGAASAVACLAASNLNSMERYAYGSLPLVVALAVVTGGRRWAWSAAASGALLVGFTALAWYGPYVP